MTRTPEDRRTAIDPVHTVFFDFGGTLVESQPPTDVWLRVMRGVGVDVNHDALAEAIAEADRRYHPLYYDYKGRMREFWLENNRLILERLGVRDPEDTLAKEIDARFMTGETYRVYPESHDALESLRRRGFGLGVLSNNTDGLLTILERLGLARCFDHVTYSQEARAEKPDPAVFRLALERAGCAPAEAVHVGDSYEADVVGARRVGLTPVLVDRGDRHREADCLRIRDLREVEGLLGGRNF